MPALTRILYVNHTSQVSGAEKVLLSALRGLDRTRYMPAVACPEGTLADLVSAEEVPHVSIPSVQARFSGRPLALWHAARSILKSIVSLRRAVFELQPDIVHANTVRAGIVASLATIGIPVRLIWHIHDTLPKHPLSTVIRLLAFFSRKTRVVAVSNSVARAFEGRFHFGKRLITIYNGIDLSSFPPKRHEDKAFRTSIGVPTDAFVLCAVGQICARKGLVELVGAFRRIHALAPQMHLVIAGSLVFSHEREYFESLQRAVNLPELSGRVHMTGEIREVSSLLRASDLLVLNSHDEPFGLVLVEAMSSGTPVVATRVGGIPEIVRNAQNGWLVESGDTESLSQTLLQLAQNQWLLDSAAATARLDTCPRFSIERFQAKLHALYEERLSPQQTHMYGQTRPAIARDSID